MTITEGVIAVLGGGGLWKGLEVLISRLFPSGEDESKVILSHSEAEAHLRQALIERMDLLEKKVAELELKNLKLSQEHQECTNSGHRMQSEINELSKKLLKHELGEVKKDGNNV